MFLTPSLLSFPFYKLMNDEYIPSKNVQGPFKSGFMFLLRLAWQSRLRLPALVFLAYMLFDIRIQFEMDIHPQRELIDDDDINEDNDQVEDDVEEDDEDDDEDIENDEEEVYDLDDECHNHLLNHLSDKAKTASASTSASLESDHAASKKPPSL